MGCVNSDDSNVLNSSNSNIDESLNKDESAADFTRSIENISEIQLSNDIKSSIVELFQKYKVSKRLFLRSTKHDMKELLLQNIAEIDENMFGTVYYALYHCTNDALPIKQCGHLTVHKNTTFHLKGDVISEYESICLEENSILTTTPWKDTYEKYGGKLHINCKTNIILHKNARIDVSGLGYKRGEGLDDYIGKPPTDIFQVTMGSGYGQLRGGGIIKMHCKKLIMYNDSKIIANIENEHIQIAEDTDRCGGTIFIDADNIIIMDDACIEAKYGMIGISINSSCFVNQFLWLDTNIFIPDVIIMLIIKYWGFKSKKEKIQILPEPHLFIK